MEQEKIGKFIKKLRKENNLTQKDLADKYGVTYQAVSKWETGKNIPDISLLKEISKHFNVNIEDLLALDGGDDRLVELYQSQANDATNLISNKEKLNDTEGIIGHNWYECH